MLGSTSYFFSDMVIIWERVEMCIKDGTILGASSTNNSNSSKGKKPYSGFFKKKEGDSINVSIEKGNTFVQLPYYPTPQGKRG